MNWKIGLLCFITLLPGVITAAQDNESAYSQSPAGLEKCLTGKVKVVLSDSGRITLLGAKRDIIVVKRAIEELNAQYELLRSRAITERVRLRYQQSDVIKTILEQAIGSSDEHRKLSVMPLHFPESVLLTGKPDSVAWAKRLIGEADRSR